MMSQKPSHKLGRLLVALVVLLAVGWSVFVSHQDIHEALAAGSLPCDIYAAAGTPCVAAHSTVRALFSAYNGRLYQVKRASDSATTTINTLIAGGYANAAAQDTFCAGTSCTITEIYDQSSRGNNLTIEGPGGQGGQDHGANAAALPLTVGGHKVYGLYVSGAVGYRDDSTSGVAKNGAPEGMYMVTSGTHYNNRCCFDYGNAETNNKDNGNGHMDAVNFGTWCQFPPCSGNGPWVLADMENGLFAGANGVDLNNTGNNSTFVTGLVKNNGQNTYSVKGGNAQAGGLTTWYSGAEPNRGGYAPMHQEGAIVLGTGGDNSNGSIGSFFEGVMTAGYPTDAADNAVQANIVSVGYSTNVGGGGGSFTPVSGAHYKIVNRNSGQFLDIAGGSTANGGIVDQWTNNNGANQQWSFVAVNGGYKLINVNSGRLLDDPNGSTSAGTHLDQWNDTNGSNQWWNIVSAGNGYYSLVNQSNGLYADVAGASTTAGAAVLQWSNNGGYNQQWSFVQV
jgi:non-reducing end alpha-L-arabinofuranosidase